MTGKWFSLPDRPQQFRLDQAQVGLLAGWGRYPVLIAEALKRQGQRVCCLGVEDHADPILADICDEFEWIGLAKVGRGLRCFRKWGVKEATFAGRIWKVRYLEPWSWYRYVPDLRALRFAWRLLRRDWKDDTLLTSLCEEFASDGIHIVPATDFAPELLVKFGKLTRRGPTVSEQRDIAFGWELAKEMGRLDVGQTVVIKNRIAMAIEAIEGTDGCIRRAGELCRGGGMIVIKVSKPQQDMRFDVPAIGLATLETMLASKARVLAVEANKTIFLDQDQVVRFADRHGMCIVALERGSDIVSDLISDEVHEEN